MRSEEQFLAVGHAKLVKNAGEMMPDRDAGNAQAIGDVFIGKPFAN